VTESIVLKFYEKRTGTYFLGLTGYGIVGPATRAALLKVFGK